MQYAPAPPLAGWKTRHFYLVLFFLVLFFYQAFGALNVCNQSDERAYIALGYLEGGRWQSRGWWSAEAGECIELLPAVAHREYYLYAYHAKGGMWSGDTPFCIAEEDFVLRKGAGCATRFFRVDTQGHEQWTHTLIRRDNRYTHTGSGRCDIVRELTEQTAPYVERFANQFFTSTIGEAEKRSITSDAFFSFALRRNGPIEVRAGKAGAASGVLLVDIPIRIVRGRLSWREARDGKVTWRSESIPEQTARVQARLLFDYANRAVDITVGPYFQWDRRPFYYFADQKVALDEWVTPLLQPPAEQMNRAWQTRFAPILQSFARGDCTWREETRKAVQSIRAYDQSVNRSRRRQPRPATTLAGKEG